MIVFFILYHKNIRKLSLHFWEQVELVDNVVTNKSNYNSLNNSGDVGAYIESTS